MDSELSRSQPRVGAKLRLVSELRTPETKAISTSIHAGREGSGACVFVVINFIVTGVH